MLNQCVSVRGCILRILVAKDNILPFLNYNLKPCDGTLVVEHCLRKEKVIVLQICNLLGHVLNLTYYYSELWTHLMLFVLTNFTSEFHSFSGVGGLEYSVSHLQLFGNVAQRCKIMSRGRVIYKTCRQSVCHTWAGLTVVLLRTL